MILDTLERADLYAILHPRFPEAIERLRVLAGQKEQPEAGRIEWDGDSLFVVIVDAPGRKREDAKLETHRAYIDIQLTVAGCDHIGWSPLSEVEGSEGYNKKTDLEFYTCSPKTWVNVASGHFAIFFPEDAHAPLANTGKPTRKFVVKVAV